MIITAVERTPRRRGRVDVYVSGKLACDLRRDVAQSRDLRPGRAIEQAEIDAIIADDLQRTALETAASMLARRPRSERELRRRLAQRKCDPVAADEAIARLKRVRLLDDAEYAQTYTEVRDRSSPRARRLVAHELRANGVEPALADRAAAHIADDDASYRAALRWLPSLQGLDYPSFRDRLGARLQRRGFGWQTSSLTIDRCWRQLRGGAHEPVDADDWGDEG